MTTNGTITSAGNITTSSGIGSGKSGTFQTLACIGNSGTFFTNPSSVCVYVQNTIIGGSGYGWIEVCGSGNGSAYIDFTTVNTDYMGRLSYTLSNN